MPGRVLRSLLRSRSLGIAIGLALTAVLLWHIGLSRVAESLQRANLLLISCTVALNLPVIFLRSRRARLLLQRLGATVSFWRVTTAQLIGLTLSGITPAAGGDLVRAYLWNRQDRVPLRTGALVVIAERVGSLAVMALVGLSALAVEMGGWRLRLLALAAWVCLVLPWACARAGLVASALSQFARLPLVRRKAVTVERSGDDVTLLAQDVALQARFGVLSVLVFLLSGAQVALLAMSLGAAVPLVAAVAAYCLSQAGGSLSNLPFGLGAADALLILLLVQGGAAPEAAAAVAVLLRLTTTLPTALAAAGAWGLAAPAVGPLAGAGSR